MTAPIRTDPALSLLDLLEASASSAGTMHFVSEEPAPTSVAQLWHDAEAASGWFGSTVGSGSTVAAVLTNTRACVTALLGAWRAGCVVASLPLPARGVDPPSYVAQLERFFRAGTAEMLLLDAEHATLLPPSELPLTTYDKVVAGGTRRYSPGDARPALVQFTSGSTGVPKGVYLGLDRIGAHVAAILSRLDVTPGDANCSWLPLSHDMGLIGGLLAPLIASGAEWGTLHNTLMKPEAFIANPASWLRTCSDKRATITTAPNFALELAIRSSTRQAGRLDLSSLRSCVVGSEAVRPATLERFAEAYGQSAGFTSLAFCPAYGMAEATVAISIVPPGEHWRVVGANDGIDPRESRTALVSTGPPLDGVSVRIGGDDLANGPGPIEIRSPAMLERYIGADLELTDDGYLVTGDLGFLDGVEVVVVGRRDDVLVVAGQNFYPTDIETEAAHDGVRPGCVAAVAAAESGFAIVAEPRYANVSEGDLEVLARTLRAEVARSIGVAPRTVAFVPRGSLAKTPSGKLRRPAIAASLRESDGFLVRVDFG